MNKYKHEKVHQVGFIKNLQYNVYFNKTNQDVWTLYL